ARRARFEVALHGGLACPLVPKLPFGNALSRNAVSPGAGLQEAAPAKPSFAKGRSQTGVWEREGKPSATAKRARRAQTRYLLAGGIVPGRCDPGQQSV